MTLDEKSRTIIIIDMARPPHSESMPHASVESRSSPDRAQTASPRRVSSNELLGDSLELLIEHAGREYRLRVTQNGKLILTA
jgi:hemin uptake protein HemP